MLNDSIAVKRLLIGKYVQDVAKPRVAAISKDIGALRMVSLTTARDRKWHLQLLHHKVHKRDSFCCAQSVNGMQCLHRTRASMFGGCH